MDKGGGRPGPRPSSCSLVPGSSQTRSVFPPLVLLLLPPPFLSLSPGHFLSPSLSLLLVSMSLCVRLPCLVTKKYFRWPTRNIIKLHS